VSARPPVPISEPLANRAARCVFSTPDTLVLDDGTQTPIYRCRRPDRRDGTKTILGRRQFMVAGRPLECEHLVRYRPPAFRGAHGEAL